MTPIEIAELKDLILFWVLPWFAGIYVLAMLAENFLRYWKGE